MIFPSSSLSTSLRSMSTMSSARCLEGRALLYLPRHLAEPAYGTGPAAQDYTKAIGREMMKLGEASRGRAFLLFSSRRMLDEVFGLFMRELPAQLKFPLLRQGDMTRL